MHLILFPHNLLSLKHFCFYSFIFLVVFVLCEVFSSFSFFFIYSTMILSASLLPPPSFKLLHHPDSSSTSLWLQLPQAPRRPRGPPLGLALLERSNSSSWLSSPASQWYSRVNNLHSNNKIIINNSTTSTSTLHPLSASSSHKLSGFALGATSPSIIIRFALIMVWTLFPSRLSSPSST